MDSTTQKPNRPKSRKSLAALPSSRHAGLDPANATTDLSYINRNDATGDGPIKRKVRGKSIGPGGLEALTESSGNATKTAPIVAIKSILKPTIPLTPPKVIPTFDELQKKSSIKAKSVGEKDGEEFLIDFSTPAPKRENNTNASQTGSEFVADPFSPMTRKSPRLQNGSTSKAQQEAEEAQRKAEKQAILDRRAARRKSLANRRVSFAPEATLHTWSVMELPEDSTTSSASNSTRRQSSLTAQQFQTPSAQSSQDDDPTILANRPSTPSEQTEDPLVKASPVHQRDLHQKKRRRRSSASSEPDLDATMDEILSSSPAGDIIENESPIRVQTEIESEDDSDTDGDTAMDLDDATITSQNSSSSTQSSLDERLRRAANQAGTRGIEYDENGEDLSMDMATDTVTNALQPWMRNQNENQENQSVEDQESINPFVSNAKSKLLAQAYEVEEEEQEQDQTAEMTMEMTKAVGGILRSQSSPTKNRRKSVASRRRSSVARRRSSGEVSAVDEESMDLTVAAGSILQNQVNEDGHDEEEDDDMAAEEMTMEFTKAVGGVLERAGYRDSLPSFESSGNETMDMTVAYGGILPPIEEQTEPRTDAGDNDTAPMEITRAFGVLLQASPKFEATMENSKIELATNPSNEVPILNASATPSTPNRSHHFTSVASETGSPSLQLKPRLSGRSKAMSQPSTTPKLTPQKPTSTMVNSHTKVSTPKQQLTPLPSRAETPSKTPILTNVIHRSASPQKLFQAEIKARASPASAKKTTINKINPLFSRNEATGQQTPSVVLHAPKISHKKRRSSGIGMDQTGLGSPRVSEILDRRSSLVEATEQFKFQNIQPRSIRFEDPRIIEQEVDVERAEEQRRESGRFIMENEANEQQEENATLQLKEMIASMSPQKKGQSKLKARKSLAVGAAKGLLGKRPAELDLDDEEEADITPKRLKAVSRESSPVKKIHLPKPPTAAETTGRLTRVEQTRLDALSLGHNITPSGSVSPGKTSAANSPQIVNRYREVPPTPDGRPESFAMKMDNVVGAVDISTTQTDDSSQEKEEEKVSLQAFLNMTNIHFIELSTTKRRHTLAQPVLHGADANVPDDFRSTHSSFVAAATTLPLLELYQHATRELKTYISSGRKIIRSIETETWTEQPLLFREYIDARPDVKAIMDNQFRNGKANARLQSKQGWYTWRSQLVDGLNAGLVGIKDSMIEDLNAMEQQQAIMDGIVPQLIAENQKLTEERDLFRSNLEELDSIDYEFLNQERKDLLVADAEYTEKAALLEGLRQQMQDKNEALAAANELKTEMEEQIAAADKVREEHRGWPIQDVIDLKEKVAKLEAKTGWQLVTADEDVDEPSDFGIALTLSYKKELRLFFYPQMFETLESKSSRRRSNRKSRSVSGPTAPISLTFVQDEGENTTTDLSTERRFFLQLIRSQLHGYAMMPRGAVTSKHVLQTVSNNWDMACKISNELRLLNICGVGNASILSDEKLGLKVRLVTSSKSRIDIEFELLFTSQLEGNAVISWNVNVNGIYGTDCEHLSGSKSRKVQQALAKEIETREVGDGACIEAVHGFQSWLQKQNTTERRKTIPTAPVTKQTTSIPVSTGSEKVNGVTSSTVSSSTSRLQPSTIANATTPATKRSPLAPKSKNALTGKKTLPIPIQRIEKKEGSTTRGINGIGSRENKENQAPASPTKFIGVGNSTDENKKEKTLEFKSIKAAMPPELQEALMHATPMTPIKRVGALRRSPMGI